MRTALAIPMVAATLVAGCGDRSADGPPEVRLGDSICDECGMIISDERFTTATIVEGPRGPEPRLFDDFNCQAAYELAHDDLAFIARWSHTHDDLQWLRTESASFLMSPALRTPMASCTAAFATRADAEAASESSPGDVVTFDIAWQRLGLNGGCAHDRTDPDDNDGAPDDRDDG